MPAGPGVGGLNLGAPRRPDARAMALRRSAALTAAWLAAGACQRAAGAPGAGAAPIGGEEWHMREMLGVFAARGATGGLARSLAAAAMAAGCDVGRVSVRDEPARALWLLRERLSGGRHSQARPPLVLTDLRPASAQVTPPSRRPVPSPRGWRACHRPCVPPCLPPRLSSQRASATVWLAEHAGGVKVRPPPPPPSPPALGCATSIRESLSSRSAAEGGGCARRLRAASRAGRRAGRRGPPAAEPALRPPRPHAGASPPRRRQHAAVWGPPPLGSAAAVTCNLGSRLAGPG